MFENPQMQVTVSGGSAEENNQLMHTIVQSLNTYGFSNVEAQFPNNSMDTLSNLRLINPELFDTKIVVQTDNVMPLLNQEVVQNKTNNYELGYECAFPFSFMTSF